MIALSPETTSLIAIGAIVLAVILLAVVIFLWAKVQKLLRGKDAESLEDSILNIQKGLIAQERFEKEMKIYLTQVENRLSRAKRGMHMVRFNAFEGSGTGGNQSFALALLNEKGDGVVISTLAARERVSVFSKTVKNFTSEFELIAEELEAIDGARKNLTL